MLMAKDFSADVSKWFLGGEIVHISCSKGWVKMPTPPKNSIFSWEFCSEDSAKKFFALVEKGRFQSVRTLNNFLKLNMFTFSEYYGHSKWRLDLNIFEKAINKRLAAKNK